MEAKPSVEDGPTGDDPTGDTSEAVVQATECPNCGRTFVGDYCPSCGQEANPEVLATGVVGGFFRELVDIENGFWPTLVGLTLRPGQTLQQYLSGVRKGLASPGRYLLAAAVVFLGARQLSRWIGALPPPVISPYMRTTGGKRDAFYASLTYFNSAAEQVPILLFLLIAMPLALSLWTAFRDQFSGGAEALAVGGFLAGHALFLGDGTDLAFAWAGYLLAVPSIELPFGAIIAFVIAYAGIACWGCFGPGWKPALKGTLSAVWAWVESYAAVGIFLAGTASWLLSTYPGAYYAFSPGEASIGRCLLVAGTFSVPLLLHVGVEVYYRLR